MRTIPINLINFPIDSQTFNHLEECFAHVCLELVKDVHEVPERDVEEDVGGEEPIVGLVG